MKRYCSILFLLSTCWVHAYVTLDGKTVPSLPEPANVYYCTTAVQFRMAVVTQTENRSIVLRNGTYNIGTFEPLAITANGVSIRGETDDPNGVVFVGKGMDNCIDVEEDMFRMEGGSNVTFANLTISESRCHGVKFQGGHTANVKFHNVHFLNIGERMIKGPATLDASACSIRYCLFEDTRMPAVIRCGSGSLDTTGDYIAGMDIMMGDSWVIHDNMFLNIKGPTGQGRAAVFLWQGNRNMTTERNTFINCDKAIAYGNLAGSMASVTGGYIRNNFIIPGSANGFELIDAQNIFVYNNTSFTALSIGNGAMICADASGCAVKNNIILGGITLYSGNIPDTAANIFPTRTQKPVLARWFEAADSTGNLHLKTDTAKAVNRGVNLADVTTDWDNLARSDGQNDIGADEYSNNPMRINIAELVSGATYLSKPMPNPCNPSTCIRYGIANTFNGMLLSIAITSMDGRIIKTLAQKTAMAGNYSLTWDGTNVHGEKVSSGVYLVHLRIGTWSYTRTVALIK